MLVILDPGHGGWDPGGGTNELWKEKELTIKISQYKHRRFQDLGIPSKLTRTGDETLTPQERVARINSMLTDNTILISNHINNKRQQRSRSNLFNKKFTPACTNDSR